MTASVLDVIMGSSLPMKLPTSLSDFFGTPALRLQQGAAFIGSAPGLHPLPGFDSSSLTSYRDLQSLLPRSNFICKSPHGLRMTSSFPMPSDSWEGNSPAARTQQSITFFGLLPPPTTTEGQVWYALFLQANEAADKADKAADKRVQELERVIEKAADKRVQEVQGQATEMKEELRATINSTKAEILKLMDEKQQLQDQILLAESKSKAIVIDRYLIEKVVLKFCRDRGLHMNGYGEGWKFFYEACIATRENNVTSIFLELVQKPGFQKLKLADVKQKLARLYESLSTSLHYPALPKNGLFAGYGDDPVRAALCVAMAIAQTTKLEQKPTECISEDTVLLLNHDDDVACVIHTGQLLDAPGK